MRGLAQRRRCTFWMKYRNIFSVMSKSAMTPSRSGRMAVMLAGVRPIIRLASMPTASARPFCELTATTDGSLRDDSLTTDEHEGVRGAQVDSHVLAGEREKRIGH